MNINDIVQSLETLAPPGLQEPYDNAGLLTGHALGTCTGVLCCLDVTEAVVDEAILTGSNLIVAHHPILFKGIKRLTGKHYVERILIKAIKNDIAIYAIHTNLDNVINGVSGYMATLLGLQHISVLQPGQAMLKKLVTYVPHSHVEAVQSALFSVGAGHIGNYSECSFTVKGTGTFKAGGHTNPYVGTVGSRHYEPETRLELIFPFYKESAVLQALKATHPYEEVAYDLFSMANEFSQAGAGIIGTLPVIIEENDFLQKIKQVFSLTMLKHTPLLSKPIKKVAICGGAGNFLISNALQAKADIYITADLKYHEFFEADSRMLLVDIGHYESEQFTIDLLQQYLTNNFPTFAVLKTSINTNPVHYF